MGLHERLGYRYRVHSLNNKCVCTNAERHKYSHSHVSGTQASGPSDVNVPYVRLSRWPDTTFT